MPCVRNIYYVIVANYITCMPGVKTGCQYSQLPPYAQVFSQARVSHQELLNIFAFRSDNNSDVY